MSSRMAIIGSGSALAPDLGNTTELLRRNRIPPSQATSVGQLQALTLQAAEECLAPVALDDDVRSRTAVFVGMTGNSALQRRNAMRVAGGLLPAWSAYGADPDAAVDAACTVLGAGPHDKIGEMASSVPSRIAIAHRLRGRALALDAHETTAALALWHARHCLMNGPESAVLVIMADEDDSTVDRLAWQEKTGRVGKSQPGRALAFLLRRETDCRPAEGAVVIQDIRCARQHGRGAFRYAEPGPDELDEFLFDIAPSTGKFGLRGDAILPIAKRSRLLAPAQQIPSGRPTGAVRVTDAMLDIRSAAEECRADSPVLVVAGSVTGAIAAVTLTASKREQPTSGSAPPIGTTVALDGVGAWFGGRCGFEAFRELSLRGEPVFTELDGVPEHAYSAGRIRLGRTYCTKGVRATPAVPFPTDGDEAARLAALDPAHLAALETCLEAVQRSQSSLSGRGLVIVATPIGTPSGRLCDVGSDDTGDAINRIGERIGVDHEATAGAWEWLTGLAAQGGAVTEHSVDGGHAGSIAAFVADELGLDAVPLAVEAACASTLAAVDVAGAAIRGGEADYALVCGVEFPTAHRDLVLCSALGMLSRTTITPFGAGADGFLPGDGAGALVLVPHDGRSDGSVTTIAGTGGSCDAHSMLAPASDGQETAMVRALSEAGVHPCDVAFVETHGTGTPRGDAVELESVRNAYGDGSIALSSVKSLLGHTFAAAGMAGLLRVVAALDDGIVPPNSGLSDSDTRRLTEEGFIVPSEPVPIELTSDGGSTLAAVSSFGTGGINYHIVVERNTT